MITDPAVKHLGPHLEVFQMRKGGKIKESTPSVFSKPSLRLKSCFPLAVSLALFPQPRNKGEREGHRRSHLEKTLVCKYKRDVLDLDFLLGCVSSIAPSPMPAYNTS